MREPTRKFLAANGRIANRPQREPHPLGTDPDVVARVGDASSLCDEPEMVSKAIVNAQTELARTYDLLRHLANVEQAQVDRKALSIEARMATAHHRAKRAHVDLSHEFHIMQRDLTRARRGGVTQPAGVLARLERLEARLDSRPDLEQAA